MRWRGSILATYFAGAISFLAWPALADGVSVNCYSPQISVSAGSTGIANVDCIISTNESENYQILDSSHNFLTPATIPMLGLLHLLTATRQPTVTSPDNTIIGIAGSAAGFTGSLLNTNSIRNLQFQYAIPTTAQTPAGLYSSFLSLSYYQYRICSSSSCEQHVYTGTAPFQISVNVQSTPVTVSCSSPTVTSTPGGGSFTLDVTCTISGNSAKQLSPSTQNMFSPSAIMLTQGQSTLSATLQPTVTSPDNSVSGISGTASGGFTGTINSLPAHVMVQYQGNTAATTKAGAYTSSPVTFTWSTI